MCRLWALGEAMQQFQSPGSAHMEDIAKFWRASVIRSGHQFRNDRCIYTKNEYWELRKDFFMIKQVYVVLFSERLWAEKQYYGEALLNFLFRGAYSRKSRRIDRSVRTVDRYLRAEQVLHLFRLSSLFSVMEIFNGKKCRWLNILR
jgi:hypothetical protein